MLLADEIVKRLRAPFAGYDLVAHGKVFSSQSSVVSAEKEFTSFPPPKNRLLTVISARGTSGDLRHPR